MPKLSGITWKWLQIGVMKKAHVGKDLGKQRGDQGREPQQEGRGRGQQGGQGGGQQEKGRGELHQEDPEDTEEQPRDGMEGAPPYDPGTSFGNDSLTAVFFII